MLITVCKLSQMKPNVLKFVKITHFTEFHGSARFFTEKGTAHWTGDTALPWLLSPANSGWAGL